ncbi:MAG: ABC transporter ATP-binding protein [Chloroflexota bacterium]
MTEIHIDGVSKVFATRTGRVSALSDISLKIESGQFVSILGPSGCGKSTLLSIVAGLDVASSGRVTIGNDRVTAPHSGLGMVFQDAHLLDWRNALDNVMLQVEGKRLPRADYLPRARSLLEQVGLADFEDKRPWELSGGMRQRVAICRALIHEPKILLFDEPFGPLDALTREQLMLDLHRLWLRDRQTVIFVTHSIPEAVFLGDVVVVMTKRPGRVHDVLHTSDLGVERDLDVQASSAFQEHVRKLHAQFQELGILSKRNV